MEAPRVLLEFGSCPRGPLDVYTQKPRKDGVPGIVGLRRLLPVTSPQD